MGNIKLPAIFDKYDQKAIKKQKTFLSILKYQYCVAITPKICIGIKFLSAVFSILLNCKVKGAFYKGNGIDKEWYENRAIAESLKSAILKLYMGATKHSIKKIDDNQITNYIADVARNKEIKTSDISDMLNLIKKYRNLPLQERKKLYVKHRIEDQISWYNKKIRENNTEAERWRYINTTLPIIYLLIIFIEYQSAINIIQIISSVFPAAISSAIGWTNTKRFNEISISYQLTANEIEHILGKKETIDNEDKFANWVAEAETIFSREHAMWAIRWGI